MPPKKKGAKAKSPAVVAKETELAQEVEQMRFEKERERLRNEEFILRQRLEEEEHKLLEDLRVRQAEIRSAVAERDMQANYVARERELTALLDRRERDTQELRAKVLGLQQAHTVLENEKESAVRRATMLSGELEMAQQKLSEVQEKLHAASAAHEEAYASLQKDLDGVRAELVSARGQREEALARVQKLQEELTALEAKVADEGKHLTETDGTTERLVKLDPRTEDAESAVLLNVLHAEVERYKELAAGLEADLDRKSRDEEKSSLLMGILNTQLDSVREENKRLHAKATKSQAEVEAVQALVESEKQRNRDLYDEMESAVSEAAVAQRQLALEVGVHQKQVEELTMRLQTAREELTKLKAQFEELSGKSTQREQEDFRTNVSMKAELDKQKQDLARVQKEKQEIEEEAFHYKILTRAEMDGLKSRLQKFQETMERKEREHYETVRVLREEATRQETERQREVNSLTLEVDRLKADLEEERSERTLVTTELTQKGETFASTEKDLYEKLVHMTACHDAKHKESEQLRERLREKEEAYTNTSIFLNAEKENLRARVEELLAEAQKRRAEHLAHVEKITEELTELQSRMTTEASEQGALYRREKSRAEMAERNVKRLQDQIREMEANTRSAALTTEDVVTALKNDARELRSELSIAKRTIERLEGAFGDQTGYNQLKELNERLTKDGETYRSQIAHLNSMLVAMKSEQDVLGGYKLQKATEEVERLTRNVRQLERSHKLTIPLFRELRAVAERAGLSTGLRTALEKYDMQMARIPTAANLAPGSSADAQHAAADDEAHPSGTYVDAAGDVVEEKQNMNSTLPAILHPRPPSGPRGASRVMEAFYDKKVQQNSHLLRSSNDGAEAISGGELPHLAA